MVFLMNYSVIFTTVYILIEEIITIKLKEKLWE